MVAFLFLLFKKANKKGEWERFFYQYYSFKNLFSLALPIHIKFAISSSSNLITYHPPVGPIPLPIPSLPPPAKENNSNFPQEEKRISFENPESDPTHQIILYPDFQSATRNQSDNQGQSTGRTIKYLKQHIERTCLFFLFVMIERLGKNDCYFSKMILSWV